MTFSSVHAQFADADECRRLTALDHALGFYSRTGVAPEGVIKAAAEFEAYLRDGAKTPEAGK